MTKALLHIGQISLIVSGSYLLGIYVVTMNLSRKVLELEKECLSNIDQSGYRVIRLLIRWMHAFNRSEYVTVALLVFVFGFLVSISYFILQFQNSKKDSTK